MRYGVPIKGISLHPVWEGYGGSDIRVEMRKFNVKGKKYLAREKRVCLPGTQTFCIGSWLFLFIFIISVALKANFSFLNTSSSFQSE